MFFGIIGLFTFGFRLLGSDQRREGQGWEGRRAGGGEVMCSPRWPESRACDKWRADATSRLKRARTVLIMYPL